MLQEQRTGRKSTGDYLPGVGGSGGGAGLVEVKEDNLTEEVRSRKYDSTVGGNTILLWGEILLPPVWGGRGLDRGTPTGAGAPQPGGC